MFYQPPPNAAFMYAPSAAQASITLIHEATQSQSSATTPKEPVRNPNNGDEGNFKGDRNEGNVKEIDFKVACVREENGRQQSECAMFSSEWQYDTIERKIFNAFGAPQEGKTWKLWLDNLDSPEKNETKTIVNDEFSESSFPDNPPPQRPILLHLSEVPVPQLHVGIDVVYTDFLTAVKYYTMHKKPEDLIAKMSKKCPMATEGSTYSFFVDVMNISQHALMQDRQQNDWLLKAINDYYKYGSFYGGFFILSAKKVCPGAKTDKPDVKTDKPEDTVNPGQLVTFSGSQKDEYFDFKESYMDEHKIECFKDLFLGKQSEGLELEVLWIFKLSEQDENKVEKEESESYFLRRENWGTKHTILLRFKNEYGQNSFTIMPRKPPPGLKATFDLMEASAKVITLMARVTMSNKWEGLSRTTYGFFIRTALLSGSKFDDQVVEDTKAMYIIASLTGFLSASTQFVLCWRLWTALPFHPRNANNDLDPSPPHLLPIWHADKADLEYSVCRTNSLVQIVCIGLFLLYALYSVPPLIKDTLIVLTSYRFISEDVDGVTRIHYYRTGALGSWLRKLTSEIGRRRLLQALKTWLPYSRNMDTSPSNAGSNEESHPTAQRIIPDPLSGLGIPFSKFESFRDQGSFKEVEGTDRFFEIVEDMKIEKSDEFDRLIEMAQNKDAPNVTILNKLIDQAKEYRKEALDELRDGKDRSKNSKDRQENGQEVQDNNDRQKKKFTELEEFFGTLASHLEPLPKSVSELEFCKEFIHKINLLHDRFRGYDDWNQILLEMEKREMIDFFSIKLSEINPETFANDVQISEKKSQQEIQLDIRSHLEDLSESLEDDSNLKRAIDVQLHQTQTSLNKLELELSEFETKKQDTTNAANGLVRNDYCDDPRVPYEWARCGKGYYAVSESLIALIFGVIPQCMVTLLLLITGVEYIMWSGSKIGSDTSGNEEIILATVAIVFINDIDDFMYDHILPELYKSAHERDLFNLQSWVQSDEPMELAVTKSHDSTNMRCARILGSIFPSFSIWPRNSTENLGSNSLCKKLKMTKNQHEQMSRREIVDAEFAKQYPLLYARKHKYFFSSHLVEFSVWAYGLFALHPIVLAVVSVAVVAGFRAAHECDARLQGIFSYNPWPDTCNSFSLATTGKCE